ASRVATPACSARRQDPHMAHSRNRVARRWKRIPQVPSYQRVVVKNHRTSTLTRRVAALAVVLGVTVVAPAIWLLPTTPAPSVPSKGFRGRVSDRNGSAVVNARIEATWIGQDDAPRTLGEAKADARGQYALAVEPPPAEQGILVLQVSAAGF